MTNLQSIREQQIDTLNDLIQVTRDSAKFYGDAATKVENPQLKTLFTDMAQSKNGLVGAMSEQVKNAGETPADSGTFRGSLHQFYTDVRAKLGDTDYAFVSELEQSEDRLLKAFNAVVKDGDVPAPVKQTVSQYLPTIREQHDLMRERKWAMKQAH